ncbi:MAG TPA: ABC transporter ATP-binding protein [Bryobacterales bacterium]|nr:ABC transporter ATP-binding protein [Bryobacterales bacterium]
MRTPASMGRFERPGHGRNRPAPPNERLPYTKERIFSIARDIWELIKPRRKAMLFGLVLVGISRAAALVLPASTKFLIDDVIVKRREELLIPIVLAVLAATIVQGVTAFGLVQLLSKAAQRVIADLRRKVQQHVGRLPIAYYDKNKTGALLSRIMNDVEGMRNLVGTGLVDLAGGLLTATIALVVLFVISPLLAGMALTIVAGFVTVMFLSFRYLRPIFRERQKIQAEVTGRLSESLSGIRVVKGYHAEAREAGIFSEGVGRLLDNVLKTLTSTALVSLSAVVMMGIVGGLVMYVGTKQIFAGTLTLGDFATFTAFVAFLVSPLYQMVSIGTQLTEAVAGLERTREVLSEKPEDEDPARTVEIGKIRGTVEFENVSFEYEKNKPVLHGISFRSEPGTVTALVGPSGSGKSTIIGLVSAFYTPSEGVVKVDGTDLSHVRLSSYRTQLGVVLQDTFLFDGTIRENVAFARPDATQEEIVAACRIASVDEFAEAYEDQYDTVVGERGVKLSGGQRQRVSIARAILADPRILILDEATSSLDSESEALIQEGLSYLMRGRTTFVIAHRLSTIRRAHQILVAKDGLIVERGRHDELLAAEGLYNQLYTRQHGLEQNLFLAPGEGDLDDDPDSADDVGRHGLLEALRLLRE